MLTALLEDFIARTTPQVRELSHPEGFAETYTEVVPSDDEAVVGLVVAVERVLDEVTPGWRPAGDQSIVPSSRLFEPWKRHRLAAVRAVAALHQLPDVVAWLGDTSPQLGAKELHPWVWDGARSLWGSGHYAEAVQAAAVVLNAQTQTKVGHRRTSEGPLFQEVFAESAPSPGRPRLRLSEDDGSKTYKSRQRGACLLGEGLYAGVRNPGVHEGAVELSEHEALEQLAAFSLLARWVDAATVVRHPDDEPAGGRS